MPCSRRSSCTGSGPFAAECPRTQRPFRSCGPAVGWVFIWALIWVVAPFCGVPTTRQASGMWSQLFGSRRQGNPSPEDADAGVAVLEYVGMIALAAILVVAVAGAIRGSGVSGVASNAVQCVTSLHCGHAPQGPPPPAADPRSGPSAPADDSGSVTTGQSQAAASTQRQLPGSLSADTLGQSPYPWLWRIGPVAPPWMRGPIWPPTPIGPWNPNGNPLPPRIVWCEVNVGCS